MKNRRKVHRTFEILREQAREWICDQIDDEFKVALWAGDSEIEKLFAAALFWRFRLDRRPGFSLGALSVQTGETATWLENPAWRSAVLVEPQARIGAFRVDFLIHAWSDGATPPLIGTLSAAELGLPRWRKLVVECDGHDFHERTKRQAARDRSRDRTLNLAGYDVFRFTGSELWRDPWGCAGQVCDWASRGVG